MIVEYIRYKVEPGTGESLIQAYEAASESLRASPHCQGFELTRCAESPETFMLRILWDSAEGHLKGFRTSREFGSFFQAVKPFVKSIEEMRHYELTNVRWTRG
ncbi:putative quinol monooxygenase [Vitiosangium sp. GDMCC 1.1324]|uniref:putative quinol monooxygenase n=1 Tax=Vitiosangium sp. (strain GDMCC 1.1324) TaxID=2138576 RepID=UPI0018EE7E90|nr:antibiotic biosynthesis monooxygenase family protein [Vitiosangium sp. GDMCC 1.1324]